MILPRALKPGDTIAVLSPSWGGPSLFPHIYEAGLQGLKHLGFQVVEFPTARMDARKLHNNPELRARDIQDAFADPQVDGIIATIGGSDAARILKYLDMDALRQNHKFFMGFSDTTAVNTWLNLNGMVVFNGPSIMAGIAQIQSFPIEYQNYLLQTLTKNSNDRVQPQFKFYSEGYLPWTDPANTGKRLADKLDDGLNIIQGSRAVSGPLFGGCMEVLEMLKGSAFWPSPDFWEGKVLFFETSEDVPSVAQVVYWLRSYGVIGVFDRIAGLIFGRSRGYSDDQKQDLERAIISVIAGEFGKKDLPVVVNAGFGHTDPQLVLPLGVAWEIRVDDRSLVQKGTHFAP